MGDSPLHKGGQVTNLNFVFFGKQGLVCKNKK